MKKTTTDLSAKHFSRYGEFLASFELSKHGWNVYNPVYIELLNRPTCDKCNGEVEMIEHACKCGSKKYATKFRSIQVKS